MTSALAWIENLGLVHGDLRLANVFLDEKEDVLIGGFDATVRKGDELLVASEPYCRLDENYETPLAGPVSEQFALASCIYTIRIGYKPFHGIEAHVRVRRLIMGEFPSTTSDEVFGDLICDCWHGRYESIQAVECGVFSILGDRSIVEELSIAGFEYMGDDQVTALRAECDGFLANERLLDVT
jgi:hypothetical protein